MNDKYYMYEICTLLSSFGQKMNGRKVLNILPFRFFGSFFFRDFLMKGTRVRTHQKYVLAQWSVEVVNEEKLKIKEFFPDTTVFTIKKLAMRTKDIKR